MRLTRPALLLIAATLGTAVALVPAGQASAAGGCRANNFCAFKDANYIGMLLQSSAPRGTNNVGVARDQVSSGSNLTPNTWVGVNIRTGLPDQNIFRFGPNTDVPYVGDAANDHIDHFDVR